MCQLVSDADGLNDLIFDGFVEEIGAGHGDFVYAFHAFGYFTERRILSIEMRSIGVHDEELAAGRVWTGGTGHGENAAGVLDVVLRETVGFEFAVNGIAGAAGSVAFRVAALNHEARNDAVENQAVIKAFVGELFEVFDGFRRFVRIELALDDVAIFHGDGKVFCHKYLPSLRLCRFYFIRKIVQEKNEPLFLLKEKESPVLRGVPVKWMRLRCVLAGFDGSFTILG